MTPTQFHNPARRRSLVVACLLLGLAAGSAQARAPSISFRKQVQIGTPIIRLGAIARLKGFTEEAARRFEAIELGSAPTPGVSKMLSRAFLGDRLRAAGVGPGVRLRVPARVEIIRKAQVLKGEALAHRIREAVRAAIPYAESDIAAIRMPELRDQKVAVGSELVIEPAPLNERTGRVLVTVRITDGDRVLHRQRVIAQVESMRTLYVAVAGLARGSIVTPAQITQRRMPSSQVPAGAVNDRLAIEGSRLRRTVEPGSPFRKAWLEQPVWVKRGDPVSLQASRGRVSVTAVGVALVAGRRGETIRVRNADSRKIIVGRVIAPDTVRMDF